MSLSDTLPSSYILCNMYCEERCEEYIFQFGSRVLKERTEGMDREETLEQVTWNCLIG